MLSQAYDTSYYGKKEEKFNHPLIEKTLDFFRSSRARRLSSMLNDGSKALDIGCGNGRFLKYLSNYGNFDLYGIELEGTSAERAKRVKGIHLKTGKLEYGDFAEESLDAITMFHVFEHLENAENVLSIIDSILKKGGILMMSFPNIDSWQSRIFKGKWLHLDPPRHLFFFRPHDFIQMMNGRGYRLVKTQWVSTEQNPYGAVQSSLNMFLKRREVLFERLKGNENYAPEYGKLSITLQKVYFLFSFSIFILTDFVAGLCRKSATVEFTLIKTERNDIN